VASGVEGLAGNRRLKKRTETPTQAIQARPQDFPLPQPISLNLPAVLLQGAPKLAGVQPGKNATIPAAA